ncbi:MAG: DUF4421 family protein, partial [Capnocytophaga granulosa]
QDRDTTYIQPYPQDIWLKAFIPIKLLTVSQDKNTYLPSTSFSFGVGVGLRKIIGINILASTNIFPLENDRKLKSNIIDLQAHKYGKYLLFDAYYQDYEGFYLRDSKPTEPNYRNLSMQQVGVETTYVWNGKRFSARAAFEQSELQVRSAGSFLFGNGVYWYRVEPDPDLQGLTDTSFENIQVGFHFGYVYTWVLGQRWALTLGEIIGANFGNQSDAFRAWKLKLHPTTMTRLSTIYAKNDWLISFQAIFNNKSVYPINGKPIRIVAPLMQISFTKHLNL